MACSGCGATTSEPARFCPACGTGFAAPAEASARPDGRSPADAAAATQPLPSRSADSLLGRTIGDFAIERVIGQGSFGAVYAGRQLGLDRPVAIKVPSYEIAADPIQARRFAREARAAARIVHPGVVAIYAVGELDDGRPYLAMQLIDGEPLDRILVPGPLPAARALRIVRDVASALSETHAAGVIHRDLKPGNVMWRRDRNGDDRITLVDFGIAVCRPGHADATRLTIGGIIGTPHYMSPELAQGEQVDGRADLYALGCLLFELVTGDTPFRGSSSFEVVLAHLQQPAPRASERCANIPPAVDELIAALLQKRPEDRPASADAAVSRIDAALFEVEPSAATAAQPAPASDAPARRPGTRRWAWTAAALLGALALSGGGFALFGMRLRGEPAAAAAAATRPAASPPGGPDEPEPSQTAQGAPVSASGEPLRAIARDDGELIMRALVPEIVRAGAAISAHVEIRTKLGQPFSARQVVVTIEDPDGAATAQTAAIHGDHPGHYVFHHVFPQPGHYIVRIFPSETEGMSMFDLDVAP